MKINKPMLATEAPELDGMFKKHGIFLCSPKLDGIRAMIVNGKLVSRNFKPIPNVFIRTQIEQMGLPEGIDGEITVGETFNSSTSAVMRFEEEPLFTFHVFDICSDQPFAIRYSELEKFCRKCEDPRVKLVVHRLVDSTEELLEYETKCLQEGYEGVMLRKLTGPYKFGRSSQNEAYLLKLKRFHDSEAKIVAIEELMSNQNEAEQDAFGRTKRSTKQENLVPAGTMGALVVEDIVSGIGFKIGTGFTQEMRDWFYDNADSLLGQIVKYKSQESGKVEKPRFPVYLGIRSKNDMDA
jgi:DNA ligase-1